MWEICKNTAAATSEFDRTVKYVEDTMYALPRSSPWAFSRSPSRIAVLS